MTKSHFTGHDPLPHIEPPADLVERLERKRKAALVHLGAKWLGIAQPIKRPRVRRTERQKVAQSNVVKMF